MARISQELSTGSGGGGGGGLDDSSCGELCADHIVINSEHPSALWEFAPTTFPYVIDDHTLYMGWNTSNADPTELKWGILMESSYQPTPSAPNLAEWHVQGWWPDSTIRRPITIATDRDTKTLDVGLRGQLTMWDSTASHLRFKITDGALPSWQMYEVALDWQVNNQPMLRGLGAGPYYIEALRINALDEVHIAANGHGTRVAGPLTVAPGGHKRITATSDGVELRGTLNAKPNGATKVLELAANGIGLHGKTPQPPCVISDSNAGTMVAELMQCLHDRGDVLWDAAQ